jgi:hypothetical protein
VYSGEKLIGYGNLLPNDDRAFALISLRYDCPERLDLQNGAQRFLRARWGVGRVAPYAKLTVNVIEALEVVSERPAPTASPIGSVDW